MNEISRREREKQSREEDILNAAERIFGSTGVEAASMDEIARASEFTRKTLYQHFGTKEELLSAVLLRGYKALLTSVRQGVDEKANGFEHMRAMGNAFYGFYREHTGFFNLINYFGRIKTIGKEEQKREFERVDGELFRFVAECIEAGRADGSIRSDLDTTMTTASVVFTTTGFFCQYSASGGSFTQHMGLDSERFVHYSLDLLLEALRPKA